MSIKKAQLFVPSQPEGKFSDIISLLAREDLDKVRQGILRGRHVKLMYAPHAGRKEMQISQCDIEVVVIDRDVE